MSAQYSSQDRPCLTEVRACRGGIVRILFYQRGDRFTFRLELPDETWIDANGTYDTISTASAAAEDSLNGLPAELFTRNRAILHLYLRHRRDGQAYGNNWVGDFKVESITTYETVANYCQAAKERGERIRIHRRKFERSPATVCCECSIKSVEPIPGTNGFKVEFHDWAALSITVEKRLQQGYYFAAPADYEPQPDTE